jgi:hypothetical protein
MTALTTRPQTLHEVSRRTLAARQKFDPALREFLDSFYLLAESRQSAIERQPLPIDDLHDAYLAAVAEHLALSYRLDVPEWSETHGNRLKQPFFAGGLESLKALLFVQSPTAFRRRMLFVSKDALSRPRQAEAEATPAPRS